MFIMQPLVSGAALGLEGQVKVVGVFSMILLLTCGTLNMVWDHIMWLTPCYIIHVLIVTASSTSLVQLTVYNYNGGPCYRCLFPVPPPTIACQSCSDSGVLGVGKLWTCWILVPPIRIIVNTLVYTSWGPSCHNSGFLCC